MNPILETCKTELKKVVDSFRKEIAGVRTNRPSAALVEDIKVPYYGTMTPLKHVGSVGIVPPREIHIQVWDGGAVQAVAKAIEASALGLSPQAEGNVVRVFLPELSAERREEFVRHVKKVAEQHRIQVRQARDESNKEVEKQEEEGAIGEDERFKLREAIQKEVDAANAALSDALEEKVNEIKE